jgi:hypothetical protein
MDQANKAEAEEARAQIKSLVESSRTALNRALRLLSEETASKHDDGSFVRDLEHELMHVAQLCALVIGVAQANGCHHNHIKHEAGLFVPVGMTKINN